MATFTGFNLKDVKLRFMSVGGGSVGLYRYLQGFFGQTAGVIRKVGDATVISGQTSILVADTSILTTDKVYATQHTAGANATKIVSYTISAGVSFTINVDTDPGTGGVVISYMVVRPVSG